METTLEFLATRKTRCEVHRHWPDQVMAMIVDLAVSEPPPKMVGRAEIVVGGVAAG